MKALLAACALALAGAVPALADIPAFTATCPGGIAVAAREGGPVTVDGVEAEILTESKYAFEVRSGDVTISAAIKPDGMLGLSYASDGGATGVCLVGNLGPIHHDEQL